MILQLYLGYESKSRYRVVQTLASLVRSIETAYREMVQESFNLVHTFSGLDSRASIYSQWSDFLMLDHHIWGS